MFKRQTNLAIQSRIYILGFPRCGNTSLRVFLNRSGVEPIDVFKKYKNNNMITKMYYNLNNNLPIYYGFEKYQVFFVPHIFSDNYIGLAKYFRIIAKQDPNALFVLNTRNIYNWLDSMSIYPNSRTLLERYALIYRLESVQQTKMHLCAMWYSYVASVKCYFPEDRLLIFDIERDDPVKLCNFIGLDRKYSRNWGRHNESIVYIGESKLWKIFKCITPQIIKNMFSPTFRKKINIKLLGHDKNAIVRI